MKFVEGTARRAVLQSLEDVSVVLMLPLFDLLRRGSLRTVGIWVRKGRSEVEEKKAEDIHERFHCKCGSPLSSSKYRVCSATYELPNRCPKNGNF